MSQPTDPSTPPGYAIGVKAVLMRGVLGGTCALLIACASVTSFDKSVVASAEAKRSRAISECRQSAIDGEFRTLAAYFDCDLGADREFAAAIRLTPMRVFESYEHRVRALAISADTGAAQLNRVLASKRMMEVEFWRSAMGGAVPKGSGL